MFKVHDIELKKSILWEPCFLVLVETLHVKHLLMFLTFNVDWVMVVCTANLYFEKSLRIFSLPIFWEINKLQLCNKLRVQAKMIIILTIFPNKNLKRIFWPKIKPFLILNKTPAHL